MQLNGGGMQPVDFSPQNLRSGDSVGLLVKPDGEFLLYENAQVVAQVRSFVPRDAKLFPFVDLRGAAVSVSLVPAALPPSVSGSLSESLASEEAKEPVETKVVASNAGLFGAARAANAFKAFPAAKQVNAPAQAPAPDESESASRDSFVSDAPSESAAMPTKVMDNGGGAIAAGDDDGTEDGPISNVRNAEPVSQSSAALAFDADFVGKSVRISEDGLRATHLEPASDALCGVVFTLDPAPAVDGGVYFEVRMEEVVDGQSEGLVLGVTSEDPQEFNDIFEVAETVPSSWTFGYDGQMQLKGEGMQPIDFSPHTLRKGDRVGLFVSFGGEFVVYVNGKVTARAHSQIPAGVSLFPFIDLLGSAASVSIVPDAVPPAQPAAVEKSASVSQSAGDLAFDAEFISEFIRISADGMRATHLQPASDSLFGVVFTIGPAPDVGRGVYFELCVEDSVADQAEGLVLGVTSDDPQTFQDVFEVAEHVPNSWTFGYDGQMKLKGKDMEPTDFLPQDLEAGDRVGLMVTREGEFILHVNGQVAVRCHGDVPKGAVLYPFVDLLGGTVSVSMLPGEPPPPVLL
eukprot:TRINITY_DN9901_c0_g1_i4.p1 TRINITY_DN9901_c0_g1~~TRINITY_DN9901_c0_g1_i4.p1  ORF type:complete len:573 (+),score=111.36 TRINITY_DN9901_c0_g1_i4:1717-3435(+)